MSLTPAALTDKPRLVTQFCCACCRPAVSAAAPSRGPDVGGKGTAACQLCRSPPASAAGFGVCIGYRLPESLRLCSSPDCCMVCRGSWPTGPGALGTDSWSLVANPWEWLGLLWGSELGKLLLKQVADLWPSGPIDSVNTRASGPGTHCCWLPSSAGGRVCTPDKAAWEPPAASISADWGPWPGQAMA